MTTPVGRPLAAVDLDRTLIYSAAALAGMGQTSEDTVPVERYRGVDVAWMTTGSARMLQELRRYTDVVPATTRTPEQYARVRLPGPAPGFAVTANGGILLVDGVVDRDWSRQVADRCADTASLREVEPFARTVVDRCPGATLRDAVGLFLYAVLPVPPAEDVLVATATSAAELGWTTSLQGRKLYWVPEPLTKSAAVAEVARRLGSTCLVAAGDSLLDADLLDVADEGIMARHGELAASGWVREHVAVSRRSGPAAGEEIVAWLLARARAGHSVASRSSASSS